MLLHGKELTLVTLLKVFRRQIGWTWALTLSETALLVAMPLLIGRSIDGLLHDDWSSFFWLAGVTGVLLVLGVGRRVYDTRAFGQMRVELGSALVEASKDVPVSTVNARLNMSRELVMFLEEEAPLLFTATIQVIMSIVILFSFHGSLALSAGAACVAMLCIYGLASRRFFTLNAELNEQAEQQVTVLEHRLKDVVLAHLSSIRRHEIRLSDTEAVVYGLIFAVLLTMLGFNLWFAATHVTQKAGQLFSIVTYSFEFLESAITLPATLQSLTRISEITQRIRQQSSETSP